VSHHDSKMTRKGAARGTHATHGAGLDHAAPAMGVGASLDHLIGTWSADDERAMREAVRVFERVDKDLWR
jgi:hypothetical protein